MELVRLALEKEGSVAALARQHDVNDNLLFKWIRLWQREGRVSLDAYCHIKCRGGDITLTHPSTELITTVLRELMRGPV